MSERRTKTFEVEYTYFYPGEKVRIIGDAGVFEVERTCEPLDAGDVAVVFIKGRRAGIETREVCIADERNT